MIRAAVAIERWEMKEVFATSRDAINDIGVIVATLEDAAGRQGRGEAAGVDYDGETGRVTITFNPIGIKRRAEHATKDLAEAQI